MNSRSRPRWIGVLLLVVLALLALGWWLSDRAERERIPVEVSVEAADEAERKLTRLREQNEEVQLSGVELSSLFRYRAPVWAVGGVEDADVEMHGDTLVLSGRVATDRLPSHPELDRIRPLLRPGGVSTARVELAPWPASWWSTTRTASAASSRSSSSTRTTRSAPPASGRRGLAVFPEFRPDLTFLDVKMARMDGLEALTRSARSTRTRSS
jgi:CheY-like chemotaxis protein